MKIKTCLYALLLGFVLIVSDNVDAKIIFSNTDAAFGLTGKAILRHCIGSRMVGWKNLSLIGLRDPAYEFRTDVLDDSYPPRLDIYGVDPDLIYGVENGLNCMNATGSFFFTRLQGIEAPISYAVGGINQMSLIYTDSHYYEIEKNSFSTTVTTVFSWVDKGYAPMKKISRGRNGTLCGVAGTSGGGFTAGRIYRYNFETKVWEELASTGITGFTAFDQVFVGDKYEIWATSVVSPTATKPYRWDEEAVSWIDSSAGISPTGYGQIMDVGADHVAWGIRSNAIVRWDLISSSWLPVTVPVLPEFAYFGTYKLIQIVAPNSDIVGVIIDFQNTESDGSTSHFYRAYKLHNENDLAPFTAEYFKVKSNIIDPELGYYGEAFFENPRTEKIYRLIGGNIRTIANFLAALPDSLFLDFILSILGGEYEVNGLVSTKGLDLEADSFLRTGPNVKVNSPINLNGGTLILDGDLLWSSTTRLYTGGNIDGQGSALMLGGNLAIPAGQSLRFTSSTIIDGRGHSLILDDDAQLIVDEFTTLSLRNLELRNLKHNGIVMISPNSTLGFQDVEVALSGDYTFTQGGILIDDDVVVTGTSKFIYESSQSSYINKFATFYFDIGSTFSYAPINSSRALINMFDASSILHFNGSAFSAPENGILLTKGRVILDNYVRFYNLSGSAPNSDIAKAITFGDGALASNDVNVKALAGAFIEVEGYLDYDPA